MAATSPPVDDTYTAKENLKSLAAFLAVGAQKPVPTKSMAGSETYYYNPVAEGIKNFFDNLLDPNFEKSETFTRSTDSERKKLTNARDELLRRIKTLSQADLELLNKVTTRVHPVLETPGMERDEFNTPALFNNPNVRDILLLMQGIAKENPGPITDFTNAAYTSHTKDSKKLPARKRRHEGSDELELITWNATVSKTLRNIPAAPIVPAAAAAAVAAPEPPPIEIVTGDAQKDLKAQGEAVTGKLQAVGEGAAAKEAASVGVIEKPPVVEPSHSVEQPAAKEASAPVVEVDIPKFPPGSPPEVQIDLAVNGTPGATKKQEKNAKKLALEVAAALGAGGLIAKPPGKKEAEEEPKTAGELDAGDAAKTSGELDVGDPTKYKQDGLDVKTGLTWEAIGAMLANFGSLSGNSLKLAIGVMLDWAGASQETLDKWSKGGPGALIGEKLEPWADKLESYKQQLKDNVRAAISDAFSDSKDTLKSMSQDAKSNLKSMAQDARNTLSSIADDIGHIERRIDSVNQPQTLAQQQAQQAQAGTGQAAGAGAQAQQQAQTLAHTQPQPFGVEISEGPTGDRAESPDAYTAGAPRPSAPRLVPPKPGEGGGKTPEEEAEEKREREAEEKRASDQREIFQASVLDPKHREYEERREQLIADLHVERAARKATEGISAQAQSGSSVDDSPHHTKDHGLSTTQYDEKQRKDNEDWDQLQRESRSATIPEPGSTPDKSEQLDSAQDDPNKPKPGPSKMKH